MRTCRLLAAALLAVAPAAQLRLARQAAIPTIGAPVQAIDVDGRGRYALTSGYHGDVVRWDLRTASVAGTFVFDDLDVATVALHPDGRLAAVLAGSPRDDDSYALHLVDLAAGRLLGRQPARGQLAWSDAGDALGVRNEATVVVFTLRDDRLHEAPATHANFRRRWRDLFGAVDDVGRYAHDVTSRRATTANARLRADHDGRLFLHRGDTEQILSAHRGPAVDVAFSPDGQFLAARGQGATTLATVDGRILRRIPGFANVTAGPDPSTVWVVHALSAQLWHVGDDRIVRDVAAPDSTRSPWDVAPPNLPLAYAPVHVGMPYARRALGIGPHLVSANTRNELCLFSADGLTGLG